MSRRSAAVTGTSVSAATVAGAAALLAQARPGLTAADLASLLVGSARTVGAAPVDPGAAAVGELAASADVARLRPVDRHALAPRPTRVVVQQRLEPAARA